MACRMNYRTFERLFSSFLVYIALHSLIYL